MKISGGVQYSENSMKTAIKAMQVQTELLSISNENIIGFDKIGYQRREGVISSFTEFLGVNGLSSVVDDSTGRLGKSDNPLDLALLTKGYFQTQDANGTKTTRDGRFRVDVDGNFIALDGSKVLSNTGMPIKFTKTMPKSDKDVVINTRGVVSVFNHDTKKLEQVATLGIVDAEGTGIVNPQVRQGCNEYSNVSLQDEFMNLMPVKRTFEANRQMFLIGNSTLQKAINQLSSAS